MIRRRKRRPALIPLASMADVAFLLIVFFMLNSNFMKEANLQLTLAKSPDLDTLKNVQVNVTVDEDGNVWLQGLETSTEELEVAVESMLEDREDRTVKLSVDRALPKKVYLPVIEALSRAGATLQLTGQRAAETRPLGTREE